MITPQLLSYIKIQLQKNVSAEEIKKILLANGWQLTDVEEGFIKAGVVSSPAVIKPEPIIQPAVEVTTDTFRPNLAAKSTPAKMITATTMEKERMGTGDKLLIFLAVIAVILLIGAGAALAYFRLRQPVLTPDQVIAKTINNLGQIKSLEYTGNLKAAFSTGEIVAAGRSLNSFRGTSSISSLVSTSSNATSSDEKMGEVTIDFSGSSDLQTINEPRSSFLLNIVSSPLGLSGATGTDFNFGLESRNLGQVFYLKLNNVPNIGFLDLSSLSGQWVKVDLASAKKQFSTIQRGTSTAASSTPQLNLTQIEQIRAIFAKHKILRVLETLPDQKISEVNTYHYRLTIDKDELKQIIMEVAPIVQGEGLNAEDIQKFDRSLASAEIPPFEVWVGKKDFFPYRLFIDSDIKNSDNSRELGKITFTVNFKNFNQPISVVAPESFKTIEEIIMSFYQTAASTTLIKR